MNVKSKWLKRNFRCCWSYSRYFRTLLYTMWSIFLCSIQMVKHKIQDNFKLRCDRLYVTHMMLRAHIINKLWILRHTFFRHSFCYCLRWNCNGSKTSIVVSHLFDVEEKWTAFQCSRPTLIFKSNMIVGLVNEKKQIKKYALTHIAVKNISIIKFRVVKKMKHF